MGARPIGDGTTKNSNTVMICQFSSCRPPYLIVSLFCFAAYLFIYFMKGKLPWSGIKVKSEDDRFSKVKTITMTKRTKQFDIIIRLFFIPIPVDRGTHFCSWHALSVIYVPGWHFSPVNKLSLLFL